MENVHNRVVMKYNLGKKGIPIGCKLCVIYGEKDENVSNLFFTYRISGCVWDMCNSWISVTQ